MIIEYLGIPGSGKTYQASRLKNYLKKESKNYLDISRHKGMPLWLKILYKIADYAIHVLPRYKRLIKQYEMACEGCRDKPKYFSLSLKTCINDIVLAALIHNLFRNNNRIIINDEGQLLRIVILMVQYEVDFNQLMQVYLMEEHTKETRFVEIPIKEAFLNIRKRNRHVCEMDELNDSDLMLYLQDFDLASRQCLEYLNDKIL